MTGLLFYFQGLLKDSIGSEDIEGQTGKKSKTDRETVEENAVKRFRE